MIIPCLSGKGLVPGLWIHTHLICELRNVSLPGSRRWLVPAVGVDGILIRMLIWQPCCRGQSLLEPLTLIKLVAPKEGQKREQGREKEA